jgi:prophage antirepressor-like protein
MDLTKFFDSGNNQITINVRGTAEDPLFQANQVGALLGIVNVRDAIKDFDEDEKDSVGSTDALGKAHQMLFLTELGLYRLLGQSRKPIARPFQKWVAKVVKDIRLTGKYELESKIQTIQDEKAKVIEENAKIAEERNEAERQLLELKAKTYEEIPKLDHIYICKEASELHSDRHKVGKSINPTKREAQFNTGSAQGVQMIYTKATHNAALIEHIVEVVMKRYAYAREHYMSRVEHTIDLVEIATTLVDTMASSYEHMERNDLILKIEDKLNGLKEDRPQTATTIPKPVMTVAVTEGAKAPNPCGELSQPEGATLRSSKQLRCAPNARSAMATSGVSLSPPTVEFKEYSKAMKLQKRSTSMQLYKRGQAYAPNEPDSYSQDLMISKMKYEELENKRRREVALTSKEHHQMWVYTCVCDLWEIHPSLLDKHFFNNYIGPPTRQNQSKMYGKFFKALRYMEYKTGDAERHRTRFQQALLQSQHTSELYKTKLTEHYKLLIEGHLLMNELTGLASSNGCRLNGDDFYVAARKYLRAMTDERFYSLVKFIDNDQSYKSKAEVLKTDRTLTFFTKSLLSHAFELTIDTTQSNSGKTVWKYIKSPHEEMWAKYEPSTLTTFDECLSDDSDADTLTL